MGVRGLIWSDKHLFQALGGLKEVEEVVYCFFAKVHLQVREFALQCPYLAQQVGGPFRGGGAGAASLESEGVKSERSGWHD